MEDAADLNLKWFFDQWLTRSGVPKVEGEWRYDAAKKQVEVTVRQTQAADAFRLHFEIGVIGSDGRMLRHKVGTDRKLERYTIPSDVAPADVVLDPGVWLLFEPGPFVRSWRGKSAGRVRSSRPDSRDPRIHETARDSPDQPDLPDLPDLTRPTRPTRLTRHALVVVLRAELL